MFSGLQWRVAAGCLALMTLVLLALGVYLVGWQRVQRIETLATHPERQARLVADGARQSLADSDPAGLDALAERLQRESGARMTLIAADGRVWGDSDGDPAQIENQAARPEVRQALEAGGGRTERRGATLDDDLPYVAVPIESGGTVAGAARVALPVQEVEVAANGVAAVIVGALAIGALLAIALAIVLARVMTRRIDTLSRAVRRLADGELEEIGPPAGRDDLSALTQAVNGLAGTLRGQIRALEDERSRLATVLTHLADGLVIADPAGVVRLINPAAVRLLEIPPGPVEGRSVMAVVRDHELAEVVRAALAGDPDAARPRPIELGLRRGRRTVQALASRIPVEDDSGCRVLLVLQDVTELRRAETVRREFVANVSHELRTPVAALKALVETLQGGALDEPEVAQDFLTRMHVEVDGLAQLVEELLELSRIESGRLALRRRAIELGAVVANAAERLRHQAERQGLTLIVAPPAGPTPVWADPERIQQVVVNLVHNAVKFTPPGGRVTITTERRDGAVAVTVADTGVGIPPEALSRLFERFYKADKARTGGGTGLGLAIAKHLVQAHGGQIWAESAGEGRGATFTFVLPPSSVSTNAESAFNIS